jgi:hypothetical protein
MFKTRYTVLAAIAGLAILSAVAPPGLLMMIASNAAAQTPPGNATTITPSGNETSSTTPSGKGTSTAATITLKPASGGAGSNVTIDGKGFSPGQTFRFSFDGKYLLTGNMIQFATGEFSTTALVPKNATSGDHEVKVAGSAGQNATANFAVVASGNATSMAPPSGNTTFSSTAPSGGNENAAIGNATAVASGNGTLPGLIPPGNETSPIGNATSASGIKIAALVLTPTSISAGRELSVAGSGFGNNQNVTLTMDGKPLDTNSTITTDASGTFTASVTIPVGMTAGNHQITAKAGNGVEASATLAVAKAPTPP